MSVLSNLGSMCFIFYLVEFENSLKLQFGRFLRRPDSASRLILCRFVQVATVDEFRNYLSPERIRIVAKVLAENQRDRMISPRLEIIKRNAENSRNFRHVGKFPLRAAAIYAAGLVGRFACAPLTPSGTFTAVGAWPTGALCIGGCSTGAARAWSICI